MNSNLIELKDYLKKLTIFTDEKKDERVKKAKSSFKFFVKTYLAHHIGAMDNKINKETSIFRNFVYNDLPKITNNKQVIKAYRGAAKTTLISRLFVLWKILKGDSRYAIIISSTLDLAKEGIDVLKTECEDNARLISDFDIKPFNVWSSEEISFTAQKRACKIKSFGAGKKIRGTNFLSLRPDFIVCDDIENDENIESKTQRDKLYKWFNKAILKLPSRLNLSYQIIVVGTTLHYDSLLSRLEKREDFKTHSFPLVVKFPKNLDELRAENLKSFKPLDYKLDDEKLNIKEILSDFLQDRASFYSEFQNLPLDKQSSPLSVYSTYSCLPSKIDSVTIGIDPSMGKARGDYFAISSLFYCRATNKIYASAAGYKITPEKMLDKILAHYLKLSKSYEKISIVCEEIAFQEFFKNTLKAKFQALGLFVPVVGIKSSTHKQVRLDALAPLLADESILIDDNAFLLKEELESYPKCAHDDLLDSIDMALSYINKGAKIDYKAVLKASNLLKKYALREDFK